MIEYFGMRKDWISTFAAIAKQYSGNFEDCLLLIQLKASSFMFLELCQFLHSDGLCQLFIKTISS